MISTTISEYYCKALERINQSIINESDLQILGSDETELVEYYYNTWKFDPIEFFHSELYMDLRVVKEKFKSNKMDYEYTGKSEIEKECEYVELFLPISPNKNVESILQLKGYTSSNNIKVQGLRYESNILVWSINTKGYNLELTESQVKLKVAEATERLIKILTDKNSEIVYENTKFYIDIKRILTNRKNALLANKSRQESLIKVLNIPLKEKPNSEIKKLKIAQKDFIKRVKPTPKHETEYIIEESIFNSIVEFVENQCRSLEVTPSSYKSLQEPELRDILRASLNGAFEGNATGETFAKNGKTDIHLHINKRNILIFECKFWDGKQDFLHSIDQLISYVSWRQNYGVFIMFCRNLQFSSILEQVPSIVQSHQHYVHGFKPINSTHYVTVNKLPEDSNKFIKIHYIFVNLYVK